MFKNIEIKKRVVFALMFFISSQSVFAQPTQAEIDKMMKQAQDLLKKYDNDSTVKNAMKGQQGGNKILANTSYSFEPGSYGNVDNWKFPAKNTVLLSALPKKIFTKAELVNFLNDLYDQLSKKLPPGVAASVQSIVTNYKNDGNKMGDAAIMGWYSSHTEEAILLIVKAAAINPGNEVLLNNCAALLTMSGIEQKAIPILKYVLQSYPNSGMVLNNLGQAYSGLGELDTAMYYFGRCLQVTPEDAEACGTAGFIEESRGNTEQAVIYFEKSLKTAFSKTVALKLRKLKKGVRIRPLIKPRIKLPDYFNQFKYDFPLQCISTGNAVVAEAEHNAFRKMITQQAQKFGAMYAEVTQKKMQRGLEIMKAGGAGRVLRKDEFMAQPFYEQCQIMAGEVLSDYTKELNEFNTKTLKEFASDIGTLENEYRLKDKLLMDAFAARCPGGEGVSHTNCPTDEEICEARNRLANIYLPKFAYFTQGVQEKGKRIFNTYFDELVYWHYLSLNPVNKDNFRIQYYYFIDQYLNMMGGLCRTKIIKPCIVTSTTTTKLSNTIKEMDCPLNFDISLVVGSIELNCDKFSIEGGEGLMLKYEKDFKTRESTMYVGIGANIDLGKGYGPLDASIGAGIAEYAFVKFDGNGKCSDAGIKMEVGSEANVKVGEVPSVGVKAEAGYTIGIESGITFDEGPLKGILNPKPEVPLNKNVKIYNPG